MCYRRAFCLRMPPPLRHCAQHCSKHCSHHCAHHCFHFFSFYMFGWFRIGTLFKSEKWRRDLVGLGGIRIQLFEYGYEPYGFFKHGWGPCEILGDLLRVSGGCVFNSLTCMIKLCLHRQMYIHIYIAIYIFTFMHRYTYTRIHYRGFFLDRFYYSSNTTSANNHKITMFGAFLFFRFN